MIQGYKDQNDLFNRIAACAGSEEMEDYGCIIYGRSSGMVLTFVDLTNNDAEVLCFTGTPDEIVRKYERFQVEGL